MYSSIESYHSDEWISDSDQRLAQCRAHYALQRPSQFHNNPLHNTKIAHNLHHEAEEKNHGQYLIRQRMLVLIVVIIIIRIRR